MSLLSFIPFLKSNAPDQVISEAWEDRNKILDDGVNLFCWTRPKNAVIHQFLQGVVNSHPQPIQVPVSKHELVSQLEDARSPDIVVFTLFNRHYLPTIPWKSKGGLISKSFRINCQFGACTGL